MGQGSRQRNRGRRSRNGFGIDIGQVSAADTLTQRILYKKELEVSCWCGRKTLRVGQQRVRDGDTDSCGRVDCSRPQGHADE